MKVPPGWNPIFLKKVWASNTTIRTRLTTVRLEKVGASTIEIRPRDIGTDTEGWSVGEAKIGPNAQGGDSGGNGDTGEAVRPKYETQQDLDNEKEVCGF